MPETESNKMRRTEFGYERTVCDCRACKLNCRFLPGYLIPADLERMVPVNEDPLTWAETHLLASPGALVRSEGNIVRVPTLVPASKTDHSCVFLDSDMQCTIHAIAPFGCAFFDCKTATHFANQKSLMGIKVIALAWNNPNSLYRKVWEHLNSLGIVGESPKVKRQRMQETLFYEGI